MPASDLIFTGSYHPLTEQDLRAFDQWLEIPLPPRYRAFLLRTNGGHPHRHLAPHGYLEAFYAIITVSAHARKHPPSSRSENMSLERKIEVTLNDNDLPPGIIPIAFCGNGDRVCLSLADDRIYLWQHDAPYEDYPPALAELTPEAEHIDDLLDKLEGDSPPVPDEEITNLARWADPDLLDVYLAHGHDINEVTSRGSSLVKDAAYHGNLEFIKACVQRGATLKGRGLLHAAAFTIDLEIMTYLLIDQRLDPNELDEQGMTPLDRILPFTLNAPAVQLLKMKGGVASQPAS
jgi:hypothetical protein